MKGKEGEVRDEFTQSCFLGWWDGVLVLVSSPSSHAVSSVRGREEAVSINALLRLY